MARKKGPQAHLAYQAILNKILTYELAPGDAVSDSALAEELSMSRSPIREAILRLTAEGMVENDDSKTLVASITLEDITEILQVRNIIEVGAVQLISQQGWLNEAQRREFSAVYKKLNDTQKQLDVAEHYAQDDLFHQTLVRFAGNGRLTDVSERMKLQMMRARWLNIVRPTRKAQAAEEHQEIYRAVVARDLERSVQAIDRHFLNSGQAFLAVLNDPNLKAMASSINCMLTASS